MYVKSILYNKFVLYTDDDKPEMTMPKQSDVRVTTPQNKQGQKELENFQFHAKHLFLFVYNRETRGSANHPKESICKTNSSLLLHE